MKKVLISALILSLAACSEPKKITPASELSDQQTIARANAFFLAQKFRAEDPRLEGWAIVPHGDSSQTPTCPQGDGWATLEFISPDKKSVVKVKCSTYSTGLGCLLDNDFQKKQYASDDGNCQPTDKVPYPLPKVAG